MKHQTLYCLKEYKSAKRQIFCMIFVFDSPTFRFKQKLSPIQYLLNVSFHYSNGSITPFKNYLLTGCNLPILSASFHRIGPKNMQCIH